MRNTLRIYFSAIMWLHVVTVVLCICWAGFFWDAVSCFGWILTCWNVAICKSFHMEIDFLYANRIGVRTVMTIQCIYFQYSLLEAGGKILLTFKVGFAGANSMLFWTVLSQAEVAPFDDLLCIHIEQTLHRKAYSVTLQRARTEKGDVLSAQGALWKMMKNDGKCIVFGKTLTGKCSNASFESQSRCD